MDKFELKELFKKKIFRNLVLSIISGIICALVWMPLNISILYTCVLFFTFCFFDYNKLASIVFNSISCVIIFYFYFHADLILLILSIVTIFCILFTILDGNQDRKKSNIFSN